MKESQEWWEHVVDALEVVNMECQAARMQLAMVAWAIEYISEAVYHHFVANREDSDGEQEGTIVPERWETQEARVGTSKVPGGGSGVAGGAHKGSEDQGEGSSGLSAVDKGKGKEKEIEGEETLQEE